MDSPFGGGNLFANSDNLQVCLPLPSKWTVADFRPCILPATSICHMFHNLG